MLWLELRKIILAQSSIPRLDGAHRHEQHDLRARAEKVIERLRLLIACQRIALHRREDAGRPPLVVERALRDLIGGAQRIHHLLHRAASAAQRSEQQEIRLRQRRGELERAVVVTLYMREHREVAQRLC